MHSELGDFKTGWFGLTLGINEEEIDKLIAALVHLKATKEHFHYRGEFQGRGGLGDIEIYFHPNSHEGNLQIEADFRTHDTQSNT